MLRLHYRPSRHVSVGWPRVEAGARRPPGRGRDGAGGGGAARQQEGGGLHQEQVQEHARQEEGHQDIRRPESSTRVNKLDLINRQTFVSTI